ncbi:3-hexulose-6-phosphate synthase [Mycolicibacterium vanbaalenii]|uniref:3-hexulose-6-phosphate synthase n=1 Tax=Mycolicibacterium vanbaalenii TaxID=110539 RepID=A0A5S9QDV1_MYCVN|nr:orotidine 5'-phosphate decarboxylase / HUMPS family protein [Mycolicibacterium vanbaalenii]CAA0115938.1 3-hexulose-6-phosphate synthase [Mycolicibacterium vanbaalenii]
MTDKTELHQQVARPVVQLCIDVTSTEQAMDIAAMGLRAGVDWLEWGTPLVSFAGINNFDALNRQFGSSVTFLDAKIMDASVRYMESAARLGINLVCICASASDATFRAAIASGRDSGVKVVADLYAVANPVARARELADIGVDYIYLHYGYDQQTESLAANPTIDQIRELKDAVELPIGVVTFDQDSGRRAVEAGADIVLISHPYLIGDDAERLLTEYVRHVKSAALVGKTEI